jgi:hypothetical protein
MWEPGRLTIISVSTAFCSDNFTLLYDAAVILLLCILQENISPNISEDIFITIHYFFTLEVSLLSLPPQKFAHPPICCYRLFETVKHEVCVATNDRIFK